MLCADCKKNVATIYINKVDDKNGKSNELIGLCVSCAKKRGIDPMGAMAKSVGNMSPEEIDALSKQFENLFSNIDMDKLSSMFGGMDFPAPDGMSNFVQDESEDDEQAYSESKKNVKTKVKEKKANKKLKYLDTFGTNLTRLAREGKLDKVIGRERELERLIQILNRRSKNNPALIGEPGVGKTAVINALALKIASGDVPLKLAKKEVLC